MAPLWAAWQDIPLICTYCPPQTIYSGFSSCSLSPISIHLYLELKHSAREHLFAAFSQLKADLRRKLKLMRCRSWRAWMTLEGETAEKPVIVESKPTQIVSTLAWKWVNAGFNVPQACGAWGWKADHRTTMMLMRGKKRRKKGRFEDWWCGSYLSCAVSLLS